MKILHEWRHGLGDTVQFTSVLQHLQKHKPDWINHVATHDAGKASAFKGLSEPFKGAADKTFRHSWFECNKTYKDYPSTKTTQCLLDVFGIKPEWDLLKYKVFVHPKKLEQAESLLASLPKTKGYVGIHYQGNTSKDKKDLNEQTVKRVCDYLTSLGYGILVFDWDRRSKLPNGKTIFCPKIPGDAETIAATICYCVLFIGIDSGPQKVAFSTQTPTLAVWTRHHPIHYCDNAPYAVHLVPTNHADYIRGDKRQGLDFFGKNYKHVVYQDMAASLIDQCQVLLGLKLEGQMLTSRVYDELYYSEHKAAGLDYLGHGKWQEEYGQWLVDALNLKGKPVLDVGCACGSIAAGIAKAGAYVSGCDINEYMIVEGRKKWLEKNLFVCDCCNLHYWNDDTFELVHSNQVCEHWKPELVPTILKEVFRVTKPGGLYFQVGDTEELFAMQGRDMAKEDPTHICIKSRSWWNGQLEQAGFILESLDALQGHPLSFWKRYPEWEGWVCRKMPS